MITRAYEFEVFDDGGVLAALPYDLEGGTQGRDFDELCMMLADWLKKTLEWYDIRGEQPPVPTYGNEPRYGGRNMLVEASAGRETADKVSASEAARILGVTRGRITQMLSSNELTGWRDGRNTWVLKESVGARAARGARKKAARQGLSTQSVSSVSA